MVGYVIWPTWESPRTRTHLLALIAADRAYARLLFAGLIDPSARDVTLLARQRSALWVTRAQAETSLERMLGEPRSNDDIPRDAALGIMAATKRIGLANLSLATIFAAESTPPLPALTPFALALESVFASTEAALHNEPAPANATILRSSYAQLASAPAIANQRGLLATLDMMVDAVNTMSELARTAA